MTYTPFRPSTLSRATAEWLRPVPWQLFATLEFPWNASHKTASRLFDSLINKLERFMRTRVCFLRALENRSKRGERVPVHIHSALACLRPISPQLVSGIWFASVGRPDSKESDLVEIESFDSSMSGVDYIVKQMGDPDCEWDIRNVHLFNPDVKPEPKSDHASLRSDRRWHQQVSMLPA